MKSLSRILGAPIDSAQVNEEFAEIAANLHHERAIGATSYLDCFRNGPGRNRLRTLTGMGIQALQQLTGKSSLRSLVSVFARATDTNLQVSTSSSTTAPPSSRTVASATPSSSR